MPLLNNLMPLVRKGGVVYFSNNYRRFKFDLADVPATEVREISRQTVTEDFRNRRIHRCWRIVRWLDCSYACQRHAAANDQSWQDVLSSLESKPLNKSMLLAYISGLVDLYQARTTSPIH